MAAEFFIKFQDTKWYRENKEVFEKILVDLPTYVKQKDGEFWFRRSESENTLGDWEFDVRIFTNREDDAFLEISAHPKSIEHDLQQLFSNLRRHTDVAVVDEDGEPSNW